MEGGPGADEMGVHRFAEVTVSLQGTIETFALPDVLVLLSSTKKSGELKVVGSRGEGRVWVDNGQIVHSQNNGKEMAPVDTIFELLRLTSGTFAFDNDATAPKTGDPQLVDLVLSDAQGRLAEWRDIERVVPHLDAVVDMAAAAPGDEVIVSGTQWKLLVAVAGGRDIHTLMERLDRSEFETCKAVKELVESNMATIDVATKSAARPPTAPARAEAKSDDKKSEPANANAGAKSEAKADSKDTKDQGEESADNADQFTRARRVRSTTSSEGSDGKADAPRVAAVKEGEGPQPPVVNGNGNGNRKAEGADEGATKPHVDDTEALVAQLAALGVDEDDPEAKAKIAARLAEESAAADGDEPINRGLLLKFLSSVRN
jgi:hypothetical protein